MAEKLLVAIAAQNTTVARWRGSRLAACQDFANDAAGLAAFKEYLAALPDMPAHVMVDAVEEDYRFETLPHAFGPDRVQMAARKLKQHYRNTSYMTAWRVGRDTDKRRDDRYLFSALTNPDLVTDWLDAIVTRGLPVSGVYLLPLVSASLPEKLKASATNLLVVALHSSGLRLTFFRDRQFRLSRLTRGEGGRSDSRARYFAEEISNTRLYLHALRTLTLDEHLSVLLLDRNDELGEVAESIARENPSLDCVRVGRSDLATRLDIGEALLGVSPYVVYLQLLGLKVPESNLAPETVTAGYRRYQARRAMLAACGVTAIIGALWVSSNLYQMVGFQGEKENAARQTAQLTREYQEVTRQFPAAPASAENLKKTVEIAQDLRKTVRTPEAVMALVSRALATSPNVVVKELAWKYGPAEISAERSASAAAPSSAPTSPSPSSAPAVRKQSALIDGEIRPFDGDFRAAITTINDFAAQIGKDPRVAEVRVVKMPLNVNSSQPLAGNTLDSPDQNTAADFKLVLVFKPNV